MAKSLRRRLQLWYAAVLSAVVGGFALLLYEEVSSARSRELDADLVAAANYLDSALRSWPRFEIDGEPPPPRSAPSPRAGRPPPNRDRLYTDLAPPTWPPDAPDRSFVVLRPDGRVLKAVPDTAWGGPTDDDDIDTWPRVRHGGTVREVVMRGPMRSTIRVARSTEPFAAEMRAFLGRVALAGGAVLLAGLAGSWWISSAVVRPLRRIEDTASRISATNLSERIDADTVEAELAGLARVLNQAFDRLEASFAQLRQFTADASHELRTPLAIMRTHAELALSRPRDAADYRATVETCLKAATRMNGIVESLLVLARADAGRLHLRTDPVSLDEVAGEVVALLRPLADEKGVRVDARLEPAPLRGDADALTWVTRNLVENAIRYNRPDGVVVVRTGLEGGRAVLVVEDTGPGIPEEDRPHLFERFYRVDKARARTSGGTGLGLAICKSLIEGHGGRVAFAPRPEGGTTFRVELPVPESIVNAERAG